MNNRDEIERGMEKDKERQRKRKTESLKNRRRGSFFKSH